LKTAISGTHYGSDDDVIGAVVVFNGQEKTFYNRAIEALKIAGNVKIYKTS